MTRTVLQRTQVTNLKVNDRFVFSDCRDGDGTCETVYVKATPTHFARADQQQAVCRPIACLTGGIRTLVFPAS